MATVSVIGAGYVGLVTSAGLAELGHLVVCVEADSARLDLLQQGMLDIHEPGLSTLIDRHRDTGRLRFTGSYHEAIPASSLILVAVNTPTGLNGEADTSHVFAAVRSIMKHARPGQMIVTKSTVPVGTGDLIAALVARDGPTDVDVVSNPEFLREGTAVRDFLAPDRIVVGAAVRTAATRLAQLYRSIPAPIVICSRRSAELAKYAANALLATRISFMNEISAICEAVDADVEEISRVVGLDHRIGSTYLNAGIGWGGSCFPKDIRALVATARAHDVEPSILEGAFEVNARQRDRLFQRLCAELAATNRNRRTVAVLGLSFKPDTNDVRDSPAIDIISRLVNRGVRVRAHDPVAIEDARRLLPDVCYCDEPYDAARGSDAILLATEWSDYRKLDWRRMYALMRAHTVVDGRNYLDGVRLSELGFRYVSVGRSDLGPRPEIYEIDAIAAGGN
jgi:UDPglucose 6-dehydrogenase